MPFLLQALSSGMSALKLKIRGYGLPCIECGLNSDEMCLLECMLSSGSMPTLEWEHGNTLEKHELEHWFSSFKVCVL